jgi:hypothetical protein
MLLFLQSKIELSLSLQKGLKPAKGPFYIELGNGFYKWNCFTYMKLQPLPYLQNSGQNVYSKFGLSVKDKDTITSVLFYVRYSG